MYKSLRGVLLLLVATIAIITPISAQYSPDILGDNFEQRTISLERDYSGEPRATLVRRVERVDSERGVLYVHGYNDYFFHRELSDRLADSSYNLYALDLRRYGRSLREGDEPFNVRDLEEYFEEIDASIEQMRREGVEDITLMGHSTGGLITTLYCDAKGEQLEVDRLILNSPFFKMKVSPFVRIFVSPIVRLLGALFPDMGLYKDSDTIYFETLYHDHHGEWEFSPELKMPISPPATAGWIRAILRGQRRVQRGLELEIPILLMYSDRSFTAKSWTPECQCSDIVLEVEPIARYGSSIGASVTHAEIERGMHDLLLSSNREARESAYVAIFEWLDEN